MYILNSNVIILDLDDKFKALVNPRISDGIKIINKIQFDLFELILKGEKIKDIEYFLCVSEESILKFIQSLVRKNIIYEAEADVCSSFKKENFSKSLDFWIHITDLCNLKCSYCFLSSDRTKGNTMEDSTIDLFIQKLTNVVDKYHINRLNIRFAGGEPLLKFDVLKDIYSKINNKFRYKLHITYSIISNLTNITSEVVSFLIQNDISIGFSIDGIGDFNNINRLMKNGGDSFSLIQKNIDLLIDAGVNKMGALVVVSDNNLDGLLDLVHFFVEKRLSYRLSIVRNAKFNYEKAIVVFNEIRKLTSSDLYPVSSSSSLVAQIFVSSVTESLHPAGISSVSLSNALRYCLTISIRPSSSTGRIAAAPILCETKSHSSCLPLSNLIVSLYTSSIVPLYTSSLFNRSIFLIIFVTLFPMNTF